MSQISNISRTTPSWAVPATCLLAAALVAVVGLTGRSDPIEMPTTPAWLTVLAAVGVAALTSRRTGPVSRMRMILVAIGAVTLAAGSVLAVPHTVLMAVVWTVQRGTGGEGAFEVEPSWLTTIAHLITVLAAAVTVAWLVAERRLKAARCARCGREEAEPTLPGARTTAARRWLAVAAVVGCLPYGVLKAAWGLGSRIGLTGHAFDDVGFASPGFGDTAVLTMVSIVVCVVMGVGARQRMVRLVATAIGTVGSLMLLPVGVIGLGMLGQAAFGLRAIDATEIAPAAFVVVYGCFLLWGSALAPLTVLYWRATAARCERHARRPSAEVVS